MTSPMRTPPTSLQLPVLTEVLMAGTSPQPASLVPNAPTAAPQHAAAAPLVLNAQALEARLLEQLSQRLQQQMQQRVHAAVVPAVAVLAERIAHKAAQEAATEWTERLQEDLQEAVRAAVRDALGPG